LETSRIRTKGYVIKQELIFIRKDLTNIPERTRTFILKKKKKKKKKKEKKNKNKKKKKKKGNRTLTDMPIIIY
jgi:hypothetical protein